MRRFLQRRRVPSVSLSDEDLGNIDDPFPNVPRHLTKRSVHYLKSKNSKFALILARQAIREDPSYSEGYLRLAEAYLYQRMYKKAIIVYSHALVNIRSTDKNYQLIRTLKNTEEGILAGPVNFMLLLPREITEKIFSYLSFRMYTVFMAVSKSWYDFVINWNVMWRDLDFSNDEINPKTVRRCIKRAQGRHVRRLVLGYRANKILNSIVYENCQNLEILEMKGCFLDFSLKKLLQSVGKHLIGLSISDCYFIDLHDVFDTLKLCPELKKLTYENNRDSTTSYADTHHSDTQDFKTIVDCEEAYRTKVEDLRIQIENCSLVDNIPKKIFQHFPQLRILDLSVKYIHTGPFYEVLNTYCQYLECLSLRIDTILHETSFMGAIRFPLQKLEVVSSKSVSASHFSPLFSSNQLKSLIICGLTDTKNVIKASTPSHLRRLTLKTISDLKGEDITLIISACAQLEHLTIDGCIENADDLTNILEHRNQSITICNSFSSQLNAIAAQTIEQQEEWAMED
ncbi:unnamed protein product [Rhizopus stolonifer]